MEAYPINRFFGLLLLTLFSFSCSSDLDFNQINDLKVEPIVSANLSYFDIPAKDFVDNGTERIVSFDGQDFDIFRDAFLQNNLKRVDLFFEITNTINRAFSVDLIFLDQNDQTVHTIHFDISASNGAPVFVTDSEIFENATLDLLKTATQIKFVLSIAPGLPLSENSPGSLKLSSRAIVYLSVE